METIDILMSQEMAYLALGITAIMLLVGRVQISETKLLNQTKPWQWFGTLIVLALGIGGALIITLPSEPTVWQRVMFGVIAAAFASTGRSILKEPLFKKLEGGK